MFNTLKIMFNIFLRGKCFLDFQFSISKFFRTVDMVVCSFINFLQNGSWQKWLHEHEEVDIVLNKWKKIHVHHNIVIYDGMLFKY